MNGMNLMTRRTEARRTGTDLLQAIKEIIKQTAIMEEALGEAQAAATIPIFPISIMGHKERIFIMRSIIQRKSITICNKREHGQEEMYLRLDI